MNDFVSQNLAKYAHWLNAWHDKHNPNGDVNVRTARTHPYVREFKTLWIPRWVSPLYRPGIDLNMPLSRGNEFSVPDALVGEHIVTGVMYWVVEVGAYWDERQLALCACHIAAEKGATVGDDAMRFMCIDNIVAIRDYVAMVERSLSEIF